MKLLRFVIAFVGVLFIASESSARVVRLRIDRDHYLGKIVTVALRLVEERYLLAEDLPEVMGRAAEHYDWVQKAAGLASGSR